MFKKLLTLTLVFLGVMSLAACGGKDEENKDLDLANEAKVVLQLVDSGLIEGDMTLQSALIHDATVTWVSGNTTYIANDGTVTQPTEAIGNVDVVLTATITVGDESVTKEFTVTVKAEGEINVATSIADVYANSTLGDIIEIEGVVTSVFAKGYFISDGTNALGVYTFDSPVAVGDIVQVKGAYAVYNTLYQLGSISKEVIVSSGNANPFDGIAVEKTVAEMLALDSSVETIHGMHYSVTGTLEILGSYGNTFLVDGDDAVLIYYDSLDASLAALATQLGKKVTITVAYYTDHGTNGPMLTFDGMAEDIEVVVLTDAQSVAADIKWALNELPKVSLEDFMLPVNGPNGSTFGGFKSGNTDIFANYGGFIAVGATSEVVTFTGKAVKNSVVVDFEFDVVVPLENTIAEVLAMDSGSYFVTTGVVYEESHYGYYLHAGGSYIFVKTDIYSVRVGDEVEVTGSIGYYSGLAQIYPVKQKWISKDNTLVTAIATTVGALENDLVPRGTLATVTGMVSIEGSYDNVYITDIAGGKVGVYYRSNADEIAYMDDNDVAQGLVGKIVTLTLVTYQNGSVLFQGEAADIVTVTEYTDQYKADAAVDAIDLGALMAIAGDITLPATNTAAAAAFVWTTSDAAVVTAAGVITRVADATPTATLTVVATVGSVTATRNIVIVLVDLNDTPLSVDEAFVTADGEIVTLTGIVSAVYYDDVVLQDAVTGNGIFLLDIGYDYEVGDELVIRGTLATYTGNKSNSKQINDGTLIGDVVSVGNALVYSTETDPAVIASEFMYMRSYMNVTMTYEANNASKSHYYLFASGTEVMKLEMNKYELGSFQYVYGTIGDAFSASFTVFDVYYDHVRVIKTELLWTDVQAVALDEDSLDITTTLIEDIELPLVGEHGSTITWATDNAAAVTVAGVIARPAVGEADLSVALTATITSGTETVDVVFDVTVKAETPPPSIDLFFSEYIEGGGSNKALELYNPTGATLDLTQYKIIMNYGSGTNEYTLIGTLASGETLLICNTSSVAALKDNCDVIISAGIVNFNGDDTVQLLKNDIVIDQIGIPANAGGDDYWKDHTYVRKSTVTMPNPTWTESEWNEMAKDDFSNIGTHTCDEPSA